MKVNTQTRLLADANLNQLSWTDRPNIVYGTDGVLELDLVKSDGTPLVCAETDTWEMYADTDYIHTADSGTLAADYSGAVTQIQVSGLSEEPLPEGFLMLENSAGETDRVQYSAFSETGGVYTFTVDDTLDYSYLANDDCSIEDQLILYADNDAFNNSADRSDVDVTTGKICVRYDSTTYGHLYKVLNKNTKIHVEIWRYQAGQTRPEKLLQDDVYASPSVAINEGAPAANNPEYPNTAQVNALLKVKVNNDFSGYTEKTVLVDADTAVLNDSEASGGIKHFSFLNLWNYVKGKADAVYSAIVHSHVISDVTDLQSSLDAKQNALGFTPVPNTLTINGNALTANITLDADDLSDGASNAIITLIQEANFESAYTHSQLTTGNPHNVTATEVGKDTAQWNASEIQGVTVNDSAKADGKALVFDNATGNLIYAAVAGSSPLTTKGDIYVFGSANTRLPVGTNGQVLSADSSEATGLKWITIPGGGDMLQSTYDAAGIAEQVVGLTATQTLTNKTLTSPKINVTSDTEGDIYYRDSSGNFNRLGIGTNGKVLKSNGTVPSWQDESGGSSNAIIASMSADTFAYPATGITNPFDDAANSANIEYATNNYPCKVALVSTSSNEPMQFAEPFTIPDCTSLKFRYAYLPEYGQNWDGSTVVPLMQFKYTADAELWTPINSGAFTGDTTNGSPAINNIPSTSNLIAGMAIYGTGIPAGATITSIVSSSQITISNNATATGTGVSLSASLERILGTDTPPSGYSRPQVFEATFTLASLGLTTGDVVDMVMAVDSSSTWSHDVGFFLAEVEAVS